MPIAGKRCSMGGSVEKSKPLLTPPNLIRKSQSSSFLERLRKPKQPSLSSGLESFEEASKLIHRASQLQRQALNRMADWASVGGNSALEDVTKKLSELYAMNEKEQKQFSETVISCMDQLRRMEEMSENDLSQREIEKKLTAVIEKEKRLQKEMKESPALFPDVIRRQLREMLKIAEERERIEAVIGEIRAENEVVKMLRFRAGMKRLTDTYVDHLERSHEIFSCQREITELVPAIATEDVRNIRYEGAAISKSKVDKVRRSLDRVRRRERSEVRTSPSSQLLGSPRSRRRSEPPRRHTGRHVQFSDEEEPAIVPGTPPPPYSQYQ